jgi:hypothetical protein
VLIDEQYIAPVVLRLPTRDQDLHKAHAALSIRHVNVEVDTGPSGEHLTYFIPNNNFTLVFG